MSGSSQKDVSASRQKKENWRIPAVLWHENSLKEGGGRGGGEKKHMSLIKIRQIMKVRLAFLCFKISLLPKKSLC